MKLKMTAFALGLVFAGHAAFALTSDEIVAAFQGQGYSRIEVRVGPTQMKVEAIRGTEKVETIFDSATGTVLKTEVATVDPGSVSDGVSVRTRARDFVRVITRSRGDAAGGADGTGTGSTASGHSNDDNGSGDGTEASDDNDDDNSSGDGSESSDDNGNDNSSGDGSEASDDHGHDSSSGDGSDASDDGDHGGSGSDSSDHDSGDDGDSGSDDNDD